MTIQNSPPPYIYNYMNFLESMNRHLNSLIESNLNESLLVEAKANKEDLLNWLKEANIDNFIKNN